MPKVQYTKLMTSGDFAAAGKSIAKRSATLKGDIQSALICAYQFTSTHGDYESSILVLLDAIKSLGKNLHRAAVEHVLAYTWLVDDETSKSGFRKDQTKKMDIDAAKAANWWETEKPPVGKPFDLQKAVQNLFDKAGAEIEAGRLTKDVALMAIYAALDKLEPDNVVERALALRPEAQNELMAVMVARLTPAAEVAEVAEVAEAA